MALGSWRLTIGVLRWACLGVWIVSMVAFGVLEGGVFGVWSLEFWRFFVGERSWLEARFSAEGTGLWRLVVSQLTLAHEEGRSGRLGGAFRCPSCRGFQGVFLVVRESF